MYYRTKIMEYNYYDNIYNYLYLFIITKTNIIKTIIINLYCLYKRQEITRTKTFK